jgi:hypothetical protein
VACKKNRTAEQAGAVVSNNCKPTIMSERQFILSQKKHTVTLLTFTPKSVFDRVIGSFTEKFDSITMFVAKWTF